MHLCCRVRRFQLAAALWQGTQSFERALFLSKRRRAAIALSWQSAIDVSQLPFVNLCGSGLSVYWTVGSERCRHLPEVTRGTFSTLSHRRLQHRSRKYHVALALLRRLQSSGRLVRMMALKQEAHSVRHTIFLRRMILVIESYLLILV